MKRIVMIFAVAGALIPIILMITVRIELYFNVQKVPLTRLFWPYLWPSSIFLLATDRPSGGFVPSDIIVLLISVLANVLLYALIGLIIASAWNFISKWTTIGSG
jgi:hypothetical protein